MSNGARIGRPRDEDWMKGRGEGIISLQLFDVESAASLDPRHAQVQQKGTHSLAAVLQQSGRG